MAGAITLITKPGVLLKIQEVHTLKDGVTTARSPQTHPLFKELSE